MKRHWLQMCVGLLLFLRVLAPLQAQWKAAPIDQTAANRGEQSYAQSCSKCHGTDARGSTTVPDLLRSLIVLHDRMNNLHGSEMATAFKTLPNHDFDFSQAQLMDLSQFLDRAVYRILRSGYSNQPTNLLSGDPKAGENFFNGAGGCSKCHSTTGDLAGIATKHDPASLQQRFLFPNSIGRFGRGAAAGSEGKKIQVTVRPSSGPAITGDLMRIDDFNVTLRDASGESRTWSRMPSLKVELVDPYAAHIALLDKYTDADIHNMTAFLETLK
jgi:cytochrome c oxidase cbb3-type subunit 3